MRMKVGAVVIGQSPRPDLVAPFGRLRPEVEVVQVGALDGLTVGALPSVEGARYPLTTRMGDGTLVMVGEDFLVPLMQAAVERVEQINGVGVTVLLCAGTFAAVRGARRPLVKPFGTAVEVLKSMGVQNLGVFSPIVAQERPIRERWSAAGFDAQVWTPPCAPGENGFGTWWVGVDTDRVEGIVLDYVGHPSDYKERVRAVVGRPVVDLGDLVWGIVAGMV